MTDFVSAFHPKVVMFRDLPKPAKMAVIWWMVVDLEDTVWERSDYIKAVPELDHRYQGLMKMAVKSSLASYDWKYGKTKWGIATIPIQVFKDGIAAITGGSFDNYHGAYCLIHKGIEHTLPRHPKTNRWPLIIDPKTGSITDGYHRFHAYVDQGAKKIGCVWLVE